MSNEILKDLQESINKNLPAQVGEELQKVLAKGKKDAEEVERLTGIITDKEKTIGVQQEQIRQLNEKLSLAGNLDEREKNVVKAERNIKIEKLEYELKAEQDKTTFAQNVALGLVKNTVYKTNVFGHKTISDGRGGTFGSPYSHNEINEANDQ